MAIAALADRSIRWQIAIVLAPVELPSSTAGSSSFRRPQCFVGPVAGFGHVLKVAA